MPIFLFFFGFETPVQHRNNEAHGWDDEDSRTVFIECSDPGAAVAWGREVAEVFVQRLWTVDGGPGPSWKDGRFANWIETDLGRIADAQVLGIPIIRVGEHPSFGSVAT